MKGNIMRRLQKHLLYALCIFTLNFAFAQRNLVMSTIPEITPNDIEFKVNDVKVEEVFSGDGGETLRYIKKGKPKPWAVIVVEYEWKMTSKARAGVHKKSKQGDNRYWLDSLTFDWKVVLANGIASNQVRSTGTYTYDINKKTSIRMLKKVKYKNVSDDDKKYAVIFVDSKTIERYLDRFHKSNLFFELRIKLNETDLGVINGHAENYHFSPLIGGSEKSTDRTKRQKLQPRRLKTDVSGFFTSGEVKKLNDSLLSRDQTPWEWSRDDSLERIVNSKED